jgi:hypothetical protein
MLIARSGELVDIGTASAAALAWEGLSSDAFCKAYRGVRRDCDFICWNTDLRDLRDLLVIAIAGERHFS